MATAAGVILGTAAYMSPEQARGQSVDKRTAIWAFGCIVFELLTGRRAFSGATVSDVLAAILTQDRGGPNCRRMFHRPSAICCTDVSRRMRRSDCATSATRSSM